MKFSKRFNSEISLNWPIIDEVNPQYNSLLFWPTLYAQTTDSRRFVLTTLGYDGGRGQVLSPVDRRPSLADHTQRPALRTA